MEIKDLMRQFGRDP